MERKRNNKQGETKQNNGCPAVIRWMEYWSSCNEKYKIVKVSRRNRFLIISMKRGHWLHQKPSWFSVYTLRKDKDAACRSIEKGQFVHFWGINNKHIAVIKIHKIRLLYKRVVMLYLLLPLSSLSSRSKFSLCLFIE